MPASRTIATTPGGSLRRFDYTPDQCAEFHSAIESEVLPAVRQLQDQRRKKLGVASFDPGIRTLILPAGRP